MRDSHRQTAFEDATKLLSAAFPKRTAVSTQYYDQWVECEKYVPHVPSLKENNNNESRPPNALKPINKFCQLLADCTTSTLAF